MPFCCHDAHGETEDEARPPPSSTLHPPYPHSRTSSLNGQVLPSNPPSRPTSRRSSVDTPTLSSTKRRRSRLRSPRALAKFFEHFKSATPPPVAPIFTDEPRPPRTPVPSNVNDVDVILCSGREDDDEVEEREGEYVVRGDNVSEVTTEILDASDLPGSHARGLARSSHEYSSQSKRSHINHPIPLTDDYSRTSRKFIPPRTRGTGADDLTPQFRSEPQLIGTPSSGSASVSVINMFPPNQHLRTRGRSSSCPLSLQAGAPISRGPCDDEQASGTETDYFTVHNGPLSLFSTGRGGLLQRRFSLGSETAQSVASSASHSIVEMGDTSFQPYGTLGSSGRRKTFRSNFTRRLAPVRLPADAPLEQLPDVPPLKGHRNVSSPDSDSSTPKSHCSREEALASPGDEERSPTMTTPGANSASLFLVSHVSRESKSTTATAGLWTPSRTRESKLTSANSSGNFYTPSPYSRGTSESKLSRYVPHNTPSRRSTESKHSGCHASPTSDDLADIVPSDSKAADMSAARKKSIIAHQEIDKFEDLLKTQSVTMIVAKSRTENKLGDRLGDRIADVVKHTKKLKHRRRGQHHYINNYLLLKTLGSGSFGKVRRAVNIISRQDVAIKIINKNTLKRKRTIRKGQAPSSLYDNVLQEIAIMKRVNHPNIVKLHEVIDDERKEKLYIILEYLPKGSVMNGDVKTEAITDHEKIRAYMRDIIMGLEYIHAIGIAHMDIKPENLLLDANDRVKLADFGVSTICGHGQGGKIRKFSGTPAFTAPETTQNQPFTAWPLDVWAVGVTLFIFAHGRPPFYAQSIVALYDQIKDTEPEYDSELPTGLLGLMKQCLVKDPEKRITIAGMKAHPWITKDGEDPLPKQEIHDLAENLDCDLKRAITTPRSSRSRQLPSHKSFANLTPALVN